MSNEAYMEQMEKNARDVLGLSPTAQLTRNMLQLARAKQEAALEDLYADRAEKKARKEFLYDAFMHLVLRMKSKKNARQREFEELYEEEMRHNPTYKPPTPKKKPTELVVTNNPTINGFFLLKGTIEDIKEMFGEWLTNNRLLAQNFSWEINTVQGMRNTLILQIRGPAEGPHAGKLGDFFERLAKDGYINPRENINALPLTPTPPKPGNKRKREEEEEQQQKKPRGLGIPKPFAIPKPGEK